MEDMPKFIITITVVLIVFVAGVAMFLMLLSPLDLERGQNQTYPVSDPTVDQQCILAYEPDDTSLIVTQYNGNEWLSVSSTWVSVNGKAVTVDSNGLQG